MRVNAKQDRTPIRTFEQLIRRYDLEAIASIQKATENNTMGLNKTNATLEQFVLATIGTLENMQNQIDGNISTWFYKGEPTLDNVPANEWPTFEERHAHAGDLYYDKDTGYGYRFTETDGSFAWDKIKDNDVVEALAIANAAQDTADGKRRVFTDTPSPPYDVGDLWFKSKEIYICNVAKPEGGKYESDDFGIATKYTDDTKANEVADDLAKNYSTTVEMNSAISKSANEILVSVAATYTTKNELTNEIEALEEQYTAVSLKADGLETTVKSHTTQIGNLTTRVTSAESSITQHAKEIDLRVKSDSVIAAINLTSETALIAAKHIDLVGAVTFSSLDSSTQSKINTASTNASNAVTTANTANTNASTAVSTANTAKTTADSAASDASSALTKANTAVTTANTASTNATSAVSTANAANTNANSALSTANSALEAANNATPFIKGTQTAATGDWTGVAPFASLVDGQQITYWLPYAGSGNATLNLTLSTGSTTGAIACYYGGATRLTTHYPAGSAIRLTYRKNVAIGSATYTGWWADANYDSGNTYDRIRYSGTVKASAAIVAGNIIVGNSSGYHHLKTGGTFDVSYPILYAGSAIASGGTGNNNYLAIAFISTTTQSLTLTAYKAVYIKGTLNGSIFTPVSTAPLTQTVPTSDDGYYYILLGTAYATTAIYLATEHPIYRYKNGAFKTTAQISSEIAAWCYNNDVTYIDGGKIYASEAFLQNIFSKNITATGTITGVTIVNDSGGEDGSLKITQGKLILYDVYGNAWFQTTASNGMMWQLCKYDDNGVKIGNTFPLRLNMNFAQEYEGVYEVVDVCLGYNSTQTAMEIGAGGSFAVADPYVSINLAGKRDVILYGPLSALDIDCTNITCTDVRLRNGISLSELNSKR